MRKLSFMILFISFIISACDGVKERDSIAVRYADLERVERKKEAPEPKPDEQSLYEKEINKQFEEGKWNDLDSEFLAGNGLEREFDGYKVSGYFDLNALSDGKPYQGVIYFKELKENNMYIFVDCEGNRTQQIQRK